MPVERIVLIVDGRTDQPFLSRVLDVAWEQLPANSPNRFASGATLRVFRETGWRRLDHEKLLWLLCRGVAPGAAPERRPPAERILKRA